VRVLTPVVLKVSLPQVGQIVLFVWASAAAGMGGRDRAGVLCRGYAEALCLVPRRIARRDGDGDGTRSG
jgi:hypothetical protein